MKQSIEIPQISTKNLKFIREYSQKTVYKYLYDMLESVKHEQEKQVLETLFNNVVVNYLM